MDIAMRLRVVCGHDSRSVTGCPTCDGADLIERLRRDCSLLRDQRDAVSNEASRLSAERMTPTTSNRPAVTAKEQTT